MGNLQSFSVPSINFQNITCSCCDKNKQNNSNDPNPFKNLKFIRKKRHKKNFICSKI